MALITISLQQPRAVVDRRFADGALVIRIQDGDLWIQWYRHNADAVSAARALAASLIAAADAVDLQLQTPAAVGGQ